MACEAWANDHDQLTYCRKNRWLIGQFDIILERNLLERVLRQFGERHTHPKNGYHACFGHTT